MIINRGSTLEEIAKRIALRSKTPQKDPDTNQDTSQNDQNDSQQTPIIIISPEEYRRQIQAPSNLNQREYLLLPNYQLIVSIDKFFENKKWNEAHQELHKEHTGMINLPEFLYLLKLANEGKLQYADGTSVTKKDCKDFYNEMTEVREPWRAEWIDESYKNQPGIPQDQPQILQRQTNHLYLNGTPAPATIEILQPHLVQDKQIDLKYLVSHHTSQGLPLQTQKDRTLYYYFPRDGCVARFYAGRNGAFLFCGWDPLIWGSCLRVRKKFSIGN